MRIVLLGAPGAGKDTLADQLKSEYNYTMISTGEIFRKEAEEGTELGVYARDKYWAKGNICPDNITNKIMKSALSKIPNKDNLIFNGYPRAVSQAEFLETIIPIHMIINLKVEEKVAVKRLLGRGREDDTEEIIQQRFRQYEEKTKPISEFYIDRVNTNNIYYTVVNANRTPKEVFKNTFTYILSAKNHLGLTC